MLQDTNNSCQNHRFRIIRGWKSHTWLSLLRKFKLPTATKTNNFVNCTNVYFCVDFRGQCSAYISICGCEWVQMFWPCSDLVSTSIVSTVRTDLRHIQNVLRDLITENSLEDDLGSMPPRPFSSVYAHVFEATLKDAHSTDISRHQKKRALQRAALMKRPLIYMWFIVA